MTDGSGTAAAGWYPDPGGSRQLRYFDGETWTEHYHDQPAETAAVADWSDGAAAGETGFAAYPPMTTTDGPPVLPDASTLLTSAFDGVKACIAPLVGLAVGYGVALGVLYAIFLAWVFRQFDDLDDYFDVGDSIGNFILGMVLLGLLAGLIFSIYILMTHRVLHQHHRGRAVSLAEAWSKTKTRLFGFYGLLIVLYIGFGIASAILAGMLGAIDEAAVVLILVPMAFVWVKLAFIGIGAVATDRGESMLYSSTRVSRGRFWPIFGRLILLLLLVIGVYVIGIVLALAVGPSGGGAAFAIGLLVFIGVLLAGMVVQSGIVKLYLDAGGPSDL